MLERVRWQGRAWCACALLFGLLPGGDILISRLLTGGRSAKQRMNGRVPLINSSKLNQSHRTRLCSCAVGVGTPKERLARVAAFQD